MWHQRKWVKFPWGCQYWWWWGIYGDLPRSGNMSLWSFFLYCYGCLFERRGESSCGNDLRLCVHDECRYDRVEVPYSSSIVSGNPVWVVVSHTDWSSVDYCKVMPLHSSSWLIMMVSPPSVPIRLGSAEVHRCLHCISSGFSFMSSSSESGMR